MSLTPEQVRAAMIPLVRALVRAGTVVTDFAGIAENLGQLTVQTPVGPIPVQMPILVAPLAPLVAYIADAQARVRVVMSPFETEVQAGFDRAARTLKPGVAGRSTADGWT